MRRLLAVSLLALVIVLSFAMPALALRDPFDPLVSEQEAAGTGTTTGDGATAGGTGDDGTGDDGTTTGTTDTDGDGVADVVAENGSEAIANTGMEAAPWLLTAATMIAVGVVALRISRHFAPQA